MSIHLSAELGSDTISADGDEVTCKTTISTDLQEHETDQRKHFALCIDSSKSMRGRKLSNAKAGIKEAVDILDDEDYISIVTFSKSTSLVLEPTQCGSNRRQIKDRVETITATGGTNIIAGMQEAKAALDEKASNGLLGSLLGSTTKEHLRWLVLVSDGKPTSVPDMISRLMPNKSAVDRHISVAEDFADAGITIQSLGVGSDYNADIMRSVAEATRGKPDHISDSSEIPDFFRNIIEEARGVVEINPELHITPRQGVTVGDIYQHEPRLNEFDPDRAGGDLIVELPDIGRDDEQELLIELDVPQDEPGTERMLLAVELHVSGGVVSDTVVVEFEEKEGSKLTIEDKKRIDTKARRLAVEASPEKAGAYLDTQDEAAVLEETRDHVEKLRKAEKSSNNTEEKELKNELTKPGLTKSADRNTTSDPSTTSTSIETESKVTDSDPSGTSISEPSEEEIVSSETTSPEGEPSSYTDSSANSEEGEQKEGESSESPAVEFVDDADADDASNSIDDAGPGTDTVTDIAAIPSAETVEAGGTILVEVRSETGERVEEARVDYSAGSTITDSRGKCEITFPDPGEYEVTVSKEGQYGTDTVTVAVTDSSRTTSSESDPPEAESAGRSIGDDSPETESQDEAGSLTTLVPIPEAETVSVGEPVTITVRDQNGNRISDVVVDSSEHAKTTDDRGRCSLSFGSSGEYTVTVKTPRPDSVSKSVTIRVVE